LATKLDAVMEYWEYSIPDRRVLIGVEHDDKHIKGLLIRDYTQEGVITYSVSTPALFLILGMLEKGNYILDEIESPNPLPT